MIFASYWGSPLVQFSKFNNFFWVCWFLGKNLWKLHNPYCHIFPILFCWQSIALFTCRLEISPFFTHIWWKFCNNKGFTWKLPLFFHILNINSQLGEIFFEVVVAFLICTCYCIFTWDSDQARNLCKIFSLVPSKKTVARENWDNWCHFVCLRDHSITK